MSNFDQALLFLVFWGMFLGIMILLGVSSIVTILAELARMAWKWIQKKRTVHAVTEPVKV